MTEAVDDEVQAEPPPIPDNAETLVVRVVDAATQAPVAGAEVRWADMGFIIQRRMAGLPRGASFGDLRELDPEDLARRFGWTARTDARGEAVVQMANAATVCARHGERYGQTQVDPRKPPPEGVRIELRVDRALRVLVRSAAGDPAGPVPLELVAVRTSGPPRQVARAESGADGAAVFAHAQELQLGRSDGACRVRAALPGLDDAGVEVDPRSPPAEPVVLQLPPCGRVLAAIDVGAVRRAEGQITLAAAADPMVNQLRASIDDDGWARFAWVPAGTRFVATASFDRVGARHEFAGPPGDGDEVRVELRPDPGVVIVAGRAVDSRGRALGGMQVGLQFRIGTGRVSGSAQTGADGTFRFAAGPAANPPRIDELTITVSKVDCLRSSVTRGPLDLPAGLTDLGELVFAEERLVVAGRFDGPGARSERRRGMSVERWSAGEAGVEAGWRAVEGLSHFQHEGAFAFGGDTAPGRHRLVVGVRGEFDRQEVEFALGTDDLVVHLAETFGLRVRVLAPPGVPAARVALRRAGDAVVAPPSEGVAAVFDQRIRRVFDDRIQVWSELPPGTYAVAVLCVDRDLVLAERTDLVLPAPGGGELPLVELDVRDLLRRIELKFRAADGAPIPFGGKAAVFDLPPADPARWQGHRAQGSGCTLVVPAGPRDLLVTVDGFRPQRLAGVDGDREVVLERWGDQEFTVTGAASPPGTELRLRVLPVTPASTARYRMPFGDEGAAGDLLTPGGVATPLQDGTVRVPVADGEHRVAVELWPKGALQFGQPGRNVIPLEGIAPATFVPGPTPVELRIDAAAVKDAVRRSLQGQRR
ncbi:MAG: hypothetical protein AB7O97_06280 [Planctomycetota bacterium]